MTSDAQTDIRPRALSPSASVQDVVRSAVLPCARTAGKSSCTHTNTVTCTSVSASIGEAAKASCSNHQGGSSTIRRGTRKNTGCSSLASIKRLPPSGAALHNPNKNM
jgi:hypothetical protein